MDGSRCHKETSRVSRCDRREGTGSLDEDIAIHHVQQCDEQRRVNVPIYSCSTGAAEQACPSRLQGFPRSGILADNVKDGPTARTRCGMHKRWKNCLVILVRDPASKGCWAELLRNVATPHVNDNVDVLQPRLCKPRQAGARPLWRRRGAKALSQRHCCEHFSFAPLDRRRQRAVRLEQSISEVVASLPDTTSTSKQSNFRRSIKPQRAD
mmetsp:Transcript_9769/g.29055  ORF Transcript_9769/g.29055 Transcript_9769/m.29055 type:complete len:210 (+) Transcript_9769:1659-2288(+)